jgi:hypothetical protein
MSLAKSGSDSIPYSTFMRCSEDKTEELAHVFSKNKCGGDGMHSN